MDYTCKKTVAFIRITDNFDSLYSTNSLCQLMGEYSFPKEVLQR